MKKIFSYFSILKNRPFYIWKYGMQALECFINFLFLRIQTAFQPNIKIGSNPRILTFNALKAERPGAQIDIGHSLIIYHNCDVLVTDQGRLNIGNNCIIGSNFRLYCKENITLGNAVLISWNVFISDYDGHPLDPDHRYQEILYMQSRFFPSFSSRKQLKPDQNFHPQYVCKPVIIDDNVWIGANVIILKGVHIGSGSILAAGAVITKDVPPGCVAAGNPARVVKRLEGNA
jgi:acetyltransferase-like isoleucine patch superfamily enzyme